MELKKNVYICKDGRIRMYNPTSQKVTSYPRFVLEQKIGRSLLPQEQVHHIDGNPLNNEIDNLEIMLLGEHQSQHSRKYFDRNMICPECGEEFLWTAKQQKYFYSSLSRKVPRCPNGIKQPFCSKQCCGRYSRREQLRRNS